MNPRIVDVRSIVLRVCISAMRTMLLLAIVGLTACAGSRRGEPTAAELAEVCERIRCRPPTKLALPMDEDHAYVVDFPATPWVAGPGLISLLPGESITITGTLDGEGRLVDLVVVDATPEPQPNTLVLEFAPPELGRMMLKVSNNFDARLIYELAMYVPMEDGLFETSAVPVEPGIISFEVWSHPIIQLAISGFHFERAE
jgi:hypothetical protein